MKPHSTCGRVLGWWACAAATMLLGLASSGCGAISALANPNAVWALDEPAPMSVVVRRAEIADATSREVERLMTETPVDEASEWTDKTALTKGEAEKILREVATNDTYALAKGDKLRVVPAEAWVTSLSGICSNESEHPNLLAATSSELADAYSELTKVRSDIEKLEADLAAEKRILDDKDLAEADRPEHEKTRAMIEGGIANQKGVYDKKAAELIAKVKELASKAGGDKKARLGVAVVNLRRAVEDAKNDNSVALLRYPMALPTLPKDAERTAKRIVADVVEEQTGTRPDLSDLEPKVKIDGTDVKLTIAGLRPTDILGLKPELVIQETSLRLTAYVERVLSLPLFVDQTQRRLDFFADILDAWSEGLGIQDGKLEDSGDDIASVTVSTSSAKAKKKKKTEEPTGGLQGPAKSLLAKAQGKKGSSKATKEAPKPEPKKEGPVLVKHTPGGVRHTSCDPSDAPPQRVAEVTEPVEPEPRKKGPQTRRR